MERKTATVTLTRDETIAVLVGEGMPIDEAITNAGLLAGRPIDSLQPSSEVNRGFHPAYLKYLGNKAQASGDNRGAVELYSQALEAVADRDRRFPGDAGKYAPRRHVLLSNRAMVLSALGDHERARADAAECVMLAPNWGKGYYRLGAALRGLGDLDTAVQILDEGARMAPVDAKSLLSLRDSIRPRAPTAAVAASAPVRRATKAEVSKSQGEADEDEELRKAIAMSVELSHNSEPPTATASAPAVQQRQRPNQAVESLPHIPPRTGGARVSPRESFVPVSRRLDLSDDGSNSALAAAVKAKAPPPKLPDQREIQRAYEEEVERKKRQQAAAAKHTPTDAADDSMMFDSVEFGDEGDDDSDDDADDDAEEEEEAKDDDKTK